MIRSAILIIVSVCTFVAHAREFVSLDFKDEKLQVHFSAAMNKDDITFTKSENYLQFDIKDTIVTTNQPFYEIANDAIEKVAVFQAPKKIASIRLFGSIANIEDLSTIDWGVGEQTLIAKFPSQPDQIAMLGSAKPDLGKSLQVSFAVSLLLVTLLIFSLVFKKFLSKKRFTERSHFAIQTLASKSFGTRHKIELIEVDGQRLLLGIGTESISLLTRLNSKFEMTQLTKPQVSNASKAKTMRNVDMVADQLASIDSMKSLIRRKIGELPER